MNSPVSIENARILLWDWNGTLLDDVDICVKAMNGILAERHMPGITREYYRRIFTFPVKAYYKKLGFDFRKNDWDKMANEFMDRYLSQLTECHLQPGVEETLSFFHDKGYPQIVLSAMEDNTLRESIRTRGILHFFDRVAGIDNHYAESKLAIAQRLMKELPDDPEEVCLIGDSLHDHEVALALGCQCILIDKGHQTHERLLPTGRIILDRLIDVTTVIATP
jgi:phosphoglycolate phosphatase